MPDPVFPLGTPPSAERTPFMVESGCRVLKVELGQGVGLPVCRARTGAMVAYQGEVAFTDISPSMMEMRGEGRVFLADRSQDIHLLTLDGDAFTIDVDNLLAHPVQGITRSLVTVLADQQIGGMTGTGQASRGNASPNVELKGRGTFAFTTSGPPLVMRVTPDSHSYADADAVIGWSSALRVQLEAAVTSSAVTLGARGSTGESWQLKFSGTGWVIVQPDELAPPYDAMHGTGAVGRLTGIAGASR